MEENVDEVHKHDKDDQPLCRVCGDKAVWATGPDGSVYVCNPCRQFFTKSVLEKLNPAYQCTGTEQGTCVVSKYSHSRCQFCRYKKCVNVGMQENATRENSKPGCRMKPYDKIRLVEEASSVKSHLPKKRGVKIYEEESVRWDDVKTAHDLMNDMEVARMLLDCYDLLAGNLLVWSDQAKVAPPPLYATLRLQYVTPEGFEILEEIKSLGGWNRDKGPMSGRKEAPVQTAHIEKENEDNSISSQDTEVRGTRKSRRRAVQKESIDDVVYFKRPQKKRKTGRPRGKQAQMQQAHIQDHMYALPMDENEPPTTENLRRQSDHVQQVTVKEDLFEESVADEDFDDLKMEVANDEDYDPERESFSEDVGTSSKVEPFQEDAIDTDCDRYIGLKLEDSEDEDYNPTSSKDTEVPFEEDVVDTDFDGVKIEDPDEDGFDPEKESSSEDEDDGDLFGLKLKQDPKDEDYDPFSEKKSSSEDEDDADDDGKVTKLPSLISCKFCGKSYQEAQNLKKHLKSVHSTQRPFQCEVCGKGYKFQKYLTKHQLIHKETSPFICSYCGRGFTNETNHRGHLRTHTGEKPYKCDLCPAAYAHNVSLKTHKKSAHGIDLWKDPVKRFVDEVDEDTIRKASMVASRKQAKRIKLNRMVDDEQI